MRIPESNLKTIFIVVEIYHFELISQQFVKKWQFRLKNFSTRFAPLATRFFITLGGGYCGGIVLYGSILPQIGLEILVRFFKTVWKST